MLSGTGFLLVVAVVNVTPMNLENSWFTAKFYNDFNDENVIVIALSKEVKSSKSRLILIFFLACFSIFGFVTKYENQVSFQRILNFSQI